MRRTGARRRPARRPAAAGAPTPARAQQDRPPEAEQVRQAARAFVRAFNDLDWPAFEAAWAEDATAFFPNGLADARLEGRPDIIARFREIFADVPDERPGPPYLSIRPRDLRVQIAGDGAVVSFHLGDSSTPNRRTVVFAKREGRWLIVHLHASSWGGDSEGDA